MDHFARPWVPREPPELQFEEQTIHRLEVRERKE